MPFFLRILNYSLSGTSDISIPQNGNISYQDILKFFSKFSICSKTWFISIKEQYRIFIKELVRPPSLFHFCSWDSFINLPACFIPFVTDNSSSSSNHPQGRLPHCSLAPFLNYLPQDTSIVPLAAQFGTSAFCLCFNDSQLVKNVHYH
jgi:hypothetical protein